MGVGGQKLFILSLTIALPVFCTPRQNFEFFSMGRTPLPDTIKAKRGTLRESRQRPTLETPTVQLLDVKTPARLKGEAKKIYERVVRQCFANGILAEIDIDALSLYAWELAELIELQKRLKDEDYVVEEITKTGTTVKLNPLVKVVQTKMAAVNAIGTQFGWSPLSRMKLKAMASAEKEKDNFSEFDI